MMCGWKLLKQNSSLRPMILCIKIAIILISIISFQMCKKITAIKEENARILVELTNEKKFGEEETNLKKQLAWELSRITVEKCLIMESKRKMEQKKNQFGIAYEEIQQKKKQHEKILMMAQDYARDREEDDYTIRLKKMNTKGWGRVKFWK